MKITIIQRTMLCLTMTVCAFLQCTDAFTTAPSKPTLSQLSTTTSLEAASRRGVLGKIRGAVVGAATLTAFRQGPAVASAEETPVTTDGRIVELQVSNVDGVQGKTGTVKIQLRPEWAPRGVKRFEVRTLFSVFSLLLWYFAWCSHVYCSFVSLCRSSRKKSSSTKHVYFACFLALSHSLASMVTPRFRASGDPRASLMILSRSAIRGARWSLPQLDQILGLLKYFSTLEPMAMLSWTSKGFRLSVRSSKAWIL